MSSFPSLLAKATVASGSASAPDVARATLAGAVSPSRSVGSARTKRVRNGSRDAMGIAPDSAVPLWPTSDQYRWPPASQLPHHHHSLPATASATWASTTWSADGRLGARRARPESPDANRSIRGGGVRGARPADVRAADRAPSSAENVALDRPLACGLASHPGRILGAAGARRSSAGVVGRPWTRACSTSSAASRGALTGVSSSASAGFLIGPGKGKSRTGVSQLISVSI
jgi:hypothetical protein